MTSKTRSALIGAALAVVLVGLAVAALFLWGDIGSTAEPTKSVVVFAAPGEDGAVVAQLVAVVDMTTGSYEIEDTTQTVAIPGTSYEKLRDAYPFGGAEEVAAALDGGTIGPGTAWVDVPQSEWEKLLAGGVEVTVKESFETFDDASDRFMEFSEGQQRVAPEDLRALVLGAAYLGADARKTILDTLAAESLRALASVTPGTGIETNLTDEQWALLVEALQPQ